MNGYGTVYGGMKPTDDDEAIDTLEQMRPEPLAGTYLLDSEEEASRLQEQLQREISSPSFRNMTGCGPSPEIEAIKRAFEQYARSPEGRDLIAEYAGEVRGDLPSVERPTWDQTFKSQYEALEQRSTCPRLRVACIAERDHQILASGYNGAPRGLDHCDDVGCLIAEGHCVRAVHDVQNLVAQAARIGISLLGATVRSRYLPCTRCTLLVIQVGIVEVVYEEIYGNGGSEAIDFLCRANVKLRTIA